MSERKFLSRRRILPRLRSLGQPKIDYMFDFQRFILISMIQQASTEKSTEIYQSIYFILRLVECVFQYYDTVQWYLKKSNLID